ncbi:hypothetical protein TWF569_004459 [Orbilia oligospora]|uniref:C2H2-type domain-containing protein n=1 Tax=Orbilia oligospora TaxID=2813651 RepID=A0A7C8J396_ORBOL|nr:hypothetical protein TWF706_001671 [Orbilia oligospora]KAF3082831.1 hypothetical protein TWF102_001064 [Orbilia oligospora]KAF3083685.1 hypothetical protein TWF103_002734 [Orbilia oligospora]KAF3119048.1 hypothetical protein TWF569_004459 [Orbilia oligospora]KAF3121153.1 hypothetical protein TWF594_003428 [Orbilia oligospora]
MPRGGRGSHSTSVPVPLTQSALDARKSFYCELCGKGYGRMNEFEAHESSYDHQHKKRFMEMKQMQRGASSVEARRERERRAEEKAGLITIKPLRPQGDNGGSKLSDDSASRTGKKGFKSAFGFSDDQQKKDKQPMGFKKAFTSEPGGGVSCMEALEPREIGGNLPSDTDDDYDYDVYDPTRPTL